MFLSYLLPFTVLQQEHALSFTPTTSSRGADPIVAPVVTEGPPSPGERLSVERDVREECPASESSLVDLSREEPDDGGKEAAGVEAAVQNKDQQKDGISRSPSPALSIAPPAEQVGGAREDKAKDEGEAGIELAAVPRPGSPAPSACTLEKPDDNDNDTDDVSDVESRATSPPSPVTPAQAYRPPDVDSNADMSGPEDNSSRPPSPGSCRQRRGRRSSSSSSSSTSSRQKPHEKRLVRNVSSVWSYLRRNRLWLAWYAVYTFGIVNLTINASTLAAWETALAPRAKVILGFSVGMFVFEMGCFYVLCVHRSSRVVQRCMWALEGLLLAVHAPLAAVLGWKRRTDPKWDWMQKVVVADVGFGREGETGDDSVAARAVVAFRNSWNWVQVSAGILAGTCSLLIVVQLVAWGVHKLKARRKVRLEKRQRKTCDGQLVAEEV
ncbi:hypothetical protein Micbo1qcDRAFT_178810 [Microdochium bolleyi]|uniref:Uncharacterized protein n=1 Tax=Microdochium bolleyi TaxID=196109 RepID=A0A136IRZ1_9PEZI|nr:hypothetical protein Micbo1qcDRAFT_178810 [Microdochium bolleyi]